MHEAFRWALPLKNHFLLEEKDFFFYNLLFGWTSNWKRKTKVEKSFPFFCKHFSPKLKKNQSPRLTHSQPLHFLLLSWIVFHQTKQSKTTIHLHYPPEIFLWKPFSIKPSRLYMAHLNSKPGTRRSLPSQSHPINVINTANEIKLMNL